MARNFTDDSHENDDDFDSIDDVSTDTVEPSDDTESDDAPMDDNEAESTSDNDTEPERKLSADERRDLARSVWSEAVQSLLDNEGTPDATVVAASFANVPNNDRFLNEVFGSTVATLVTENADALTPVTLLKNDVQALLTTATVRAERGPTPEELRAALVTSVARGIFVENCIKFALSGIDVNIGGLGDLTDEEAFVLDNFEPDDKLVGQLDRIATLITQATTNKGSKRGSRGSGSAENKCSADDWKSGAKFVHKGRDGSVTATAEVADDGTITVTRMHDGQSATGELDRNGAFAPFKIDNAGAKRSAGWASGNNENGYRYWEVAA